MKKPPADFAARRAAGESIHALAQSYGATNSTVKRWSELPAVLQEIEEIRAAVLAEASARLGSLADTAVEAIAAVLKTGACEKCGRPTAPDRDRLKAADMILNRVGLESGERREVTARIAPNAGADARLILQEAALILEERGLMELAVAVRAESRR